MQQCSALRGSQSTCIFHTHTDFYESLRSVDTTLGSTAFFSCYVEDSHYTYEEYSIFWLVYNNTAGYSFSVNDSEGEIIIDGSTSHCLIYCNSFLSIPAYEVNNNTEIQCQASFDNCPGDLQNSSIATLHIRGTYIV